MLAKWTETLLLTEVVLNNSALAQSTNQVRDIQYIQVTKRILQQFIMPACIQLWWWRVIDTVSWVCTNVLLCSSWVQNYSGWIFLHMHIAPKVAVCEGKNSQIKANGSQIQFYGKYWNTVRAEIKRALNIYRRHSCRQGWHTSSSGEARGLPNREGGLVMLWWIIQEAQLSQRNSTSAAHVEGARPSSPLPLRPLWLHLWVWSNSKATTLVRQACRPLSAL